MYRKDESWGGRRDRNRDRDRDRSPVYTGQYSTIVPIVSVNLIGCC